MGKFASAAGKIAVGIVELGIGSIQSTAETYSKSDKIPEEYREKYANISEGMTNIKGKVHEYRTNMGKKPLSDEENFELDDYEEDLESDNEILDTGIKKEILSDVQEVKIYNSKEKEALQLSSATKPTMNITESDLEWFDLGCLKDIDIKNVAVSGVGIIELVVDNEPLYIIRAIELNNGGIKKKLSDLQNYNAKNISRMYTKIGDNIDKIKVRVACLGNDADSVANTRKMEKELLLKYHLIN